MSGASIPYNFILFNMDVIPLTVQIYGTSLKLHYFYIIHHYYFHKLTTKSSNLNHSHARKETLHLNVKCFFITFQVLLK